MSHWLPNVPRRGLGDLVSSVNHIALIVSDVGRSTVFYTEVLGFQQIRRPNFDRHGAWLTAGNLEIHLIKGTPLVHTGENLIVSHIALDLEDAEIAFDRLREMRVPFEVNVSVPRGEGKAESEGGERNNTLSQAFIRDPDGYYFELCNCNVLTDFALGRTLGLGDTLGSNDDSNPQERRGAAIVSPFILMKFIVHALRARRRCAKRRAANDIKLTLLAAEDQPEQANPVILANFKVRRAVYGDICQSFSDKELEHILLQAGNNAPKALLLMQGRIKDGHNKRIFIPPAYYVEKHHDELGDSGTKFCPKPFEDAERRSLSLCATTAALASIARAA